MSKLDFNIPTRLRTPRFTKRLKNLIGLQFTRLTPLGLLGNSPSGTSWLCRCSCGQFLCTSASHLMKNKVKSCGCLSRENVKKRNFKHGHSGGTPSYIYRIYRGIQARCTNPSYHAYFQYGGRGITLQPSWLNSFPCFLADITRTIGLPPSEKYSLDRIDGNGNYQEGNLRWATAKEQARNQRTNHRIMIGGQTKCLAEWLEITNTVGRTFRQRRRRGLSLRQSFGLAPPPPPLRRVKPSR